MDPYIGEIRLFAGNFAPYGWHFCDGSLLPITQNTALFSLLGTYYGGDGRTTFGLPDLRGRTPIHQGAGPGLTPRTIGETDGSPYVTLVTTEMPIHNHVAAGIAQQGADTSPVNNVWAETVGSGRGGQQSPLYVPGPLDTQMSPSALAISGGSQPHNNMQPYLALNYIIATQGIFPPRQ